MLLTQQALTPVKPCADPGQQGPDQQGATDRDDYMKCIDGFILDQADEQQVLTQALVLLSPMHKRGQITDYGTGLPATLLSVQFSNRHKWEVFARR